MPPPVWPTHRMSSPWSLRGPGQNRSSRAFFHECHEIVEEVAGVVGTRRGLGMILDAEERKRAVAHAFVRVIVQIDVRDLDIALRERIRIDAEAMILGGDFDFLREEI